MQKMFRPKKDEVMGGWKKLNNEELHDLYCLPSIIRITKSRRMMGRAYSMNAAEEECIYDFDGKARKKETTRKPRLM
jgi:hypothetical protein